MSKYDLSGLQASAQEEIEENEKKTKEREGFPLVYPIDNGTFRIKLLFNPISNSVQRKITRHQVGKDKIPCMAVYGEDCPICSAIKNAEDEHGKDCGAWSKYGYKTRGISLAVLVDHDAGMFKGNNDPKKGDVILFMYPPTLYNKINEIIVKAGSHLEDLVVNNNGKTIEITRKQKNGGFPEYDVSVYAYGDEKVKETDKEFEELLDSLPDINEQMMPNYPNEEIREKVRAAAESIDVEYASGRVLNPNNPPEENNSSANDSIKQSSSGNISQDISNANNDTGDKPECFGNHCDDSKCLICPFECDCMISE